MENNDQEQPRVLRLASVQDKVEGKKYTVKFDDYTFDLRVKPTPCGVDVSFVREPSEDEKKSLSGLMVIFGNQANTLVSDHIHPRWWWTLTGKTIEGEIEKFVKRIQKDAEKYARNKNAASRFIQ